MKPRQIYPDIEERAKAEVVIDWSPPPVTTIVSPAEYAALEAELARPRMHPNPNRKQRKRATATYADPKDEPGLRRKLLLQRKRRARGTLDVETRRLQRKAKRS